MLTAGELRAANVYGEWLRLAVHERTVPANARVRAAGGCLIIAQDHHHAIVVLLGARLYASCFALVRIAFEAYVRGEWLALCATDKEAKQFLKGKEPPRIDAMLKALELKDAFKDGALSIIKKRTWKAMCSYTHTGGLHVQRWNTSDGIEPNYSREEILEVLRFADIIVALSVFGMARIMNDESLAERVSQRFVARVKE